MSDNFISHVGSTARKAGRFEGALRALLFRVWRDNERPPHPAYAEAIEAGPKPARNARP